MAAFRNPVRLSLDAERFAGCKLVARRYALEVQQRFGIILRHAHGGRMRHQFVDRKALRIFIADFGTGEKDTDATGRIIGIIGNVCATRQRRRKSVGGRNDENPFQ